ncbi:glycosyltransferase family 4 protein [Rubrolithibacter danxiaensis]|uniref:glycosyltransferase family 4 protein n=1 Tax=Rubrolithibacter danxiaensis TaxID=3390805 RepID=UPI003BF85A2B
MLIGYDGKRIIQNFTGLGNYSRYVLNLMACNFPQNSYFIYSSKKAAAGLRFAENKSVYYKSPERLYAPAIWRTFGMVKDLKKDQIDLYHGLSNEIPAGLKRAKIPSVVTIHDLIFLRYPEYYKFIDRKIYEWKVNYACQNATKIIAVSEKTKEDLITFFKVPEKRIEVIFQSCHPVFRQKSTETEKNAVRKQYNLPSKYILNVGTIEKRKNLLLIAKALKSVPDDVHLVVIGKQTDYAASVKQYLRSHKLSSRVHFLSRVPLEDLPHIYQQAEMFIYPSEYEGFGIPVIEALHSEIPVIAATGSCLEEAGGPDTCYVHPKDEIQLAFFINSILNHPEKKRKTIQNGKIHLENFSDERISRQLMDLYIQTVNNA